MGFRSVGNQFGISVLQNAPASGLAPLVNGANTSVRARCGARRDQDEKVGAAAAQAKDKG